MLKFVSLAAKQGRYEIARQTIKKILPDVDAWDIAFNSGDPNHYMNGPLNGARRDLENFSTTKMTVLYKHIKHNVMPHKVGCPPKSFLAISSGKSPEIVYFWHAYKKSYFSHYIKKLELVLISSAIEF